MNDLLSHQHVVRRASPARPVRGKARKEKIPPRDLREWTRQAPGARGRGRETARGTAARGTATRGTATRREIYGKEFPGTGAGAGRRGAALSLPLLPVAGALMLCFGGLLAYYNQDAFSLAWTRRDVIPAVAADGAAAEGTYDLALYAGVVPAAGGAAAPAEAGVAIPLDLAETFRWEDYTVKKGDSVSSIAASHTLSMDAVIASNNISNARLLREGERLRIPNMDGIPYVVKKGDSLSKISTDMGVPLEAILDANDIQRDAVAVGETLFIPGARMPAEDLRLALGELFVYPVKGAYLSSPFGWRNDPISGVRRNHAAVDLAAPMGTVVRAASGGRVSATGYNSTYGNFIIINHGNDFQTMYAHLSVVSVKEGHTVAQSEKIGEVGSTGYSTGPHLHFAVYKNGRAVNPLDLLSPKR